MGKMKAHITGTVEDNQLTAVAKLPLGSAQIHGIRREEA
jgi:alkylated DNA repair dioxygenase AlkB